MGEAILGTFISTAGCALDTRMWKPEGEPRGIVQLVHGMAEHIDRYDATAKRLNEAGFAMKADGTLETLRAKHFKDILGT